MLINQDQRCWWYVSKNRYDPLAQSLKNSVHFCIVLNSKIQKYCIFVWYLKTSKRFSTTECEELIFDISSVKHVELVVWERVLNCEDLKCKFGSLTWWISWMVTYSLIFIIFLIWFADSLSWIANCISL